MKEVLSGCAVRAAIQRELQNDVAAIARETAARERDPQVNEKQERWDRHWLKVALITAEMSKDPDKQVGAVIVGPDNIRISDGFNGFPRGIADTEGRLRDKELKNRLMVHAERNALLNAARLGGRSLLNTTLYFACFDDSGVHGGCPCTACTIELIQAGITEIVAYPVKANTRWYNDIAFASELLREAGVIYREIQP